MNEPTYQHPKACWYKHTSGDTKCIWCDDQERWATKLGETVIARDRYRAWLLHALVQLEWHGDASGARRMLVNLHIPLEDFQKARAAGEPKC